MAKIDVEIKNMRNEIEELKRSLDQINFNIVRIMGQLEKGGTPVATDEEGAPITGSVSVDLGPIENRIETLEDNMATKAEVQEITGKLDELVSEKIKKTEELQVRANNLLEKGMELIELQSTLAEIKTLLEERILGDLEEENKEEQEAEG